MENAVAWKENSKVLVSDMKFTANNGASLGDIFGEINHYTKENA